MQINEYTWWLKKIKKCRSMGVSVGGPRCDWSGAKFGVEAAALVEHRDVCGRRDVMIANNTSPP
jgi:hypothetical protein